VVTTALVVMQQQLDGLRLGEGLVPVDSKFPMENFERLCRADSAAVGEDH
jgi:hypothetical protein